MPYLLNTRKNEGLIKYENTLLEQYNTSEKANENMFIEQKSPNHNQNSNTFITEDIDNSEITNKVKNNMNNISKTLIDKLRKESGKTLLQRYVTKTETDKKNYNFQILYEFIENAKAMLNKK